MKSVEVVAAAIVRDGRVLATQRGYGEFEGGWEFPGGKVESGETPEEALVREIREELDATVAVDRFLTLVEYDYPTFHLVMRVYVCHVAAGHLTLLEHHSARWADADDIDELAWLPADAPVVEELKARGLLAGAGAAPAADAGVDAGASATASASPAAAPADEVARP